MRQFNSYVECISRTVEARPGEPQNLRKYLLTLAAFSQNVEQNIPLMHSSVHQLEAARRVGDVVQCLVQEYCSFLNCDIFGMIADKYDADCGRPEMRYPSFLKVFVESHNIADFIQVRILVEWVETERGWVGGIEGGNVKGIEEM